MTIHRKLSSDTASGLDVTGAVAASGATAATALPPLIMLAAAALFALFALFIVGCTGSPSTAASASGRADAEQQRLLQELPRYQAEEGITGELRIVGSDTLKTAMLMLSETFMDYHPDVDISLRSAGSELGPPALINGTAQIASMSRPMRTAEIARFRQQFGYSPAGVSFALDAIAVFVHRENPVASLHMNQLQAIFSDPPGTSAITRWGDVDLGGSWADQSISIVGRSPDSGTYELFRDAVLDGRGFSGDRYNVYPSSSAVVRAIAENPAAIGYSGIGYAYAAVRAVPVQADGIPYAPTAEHVAAGRYPLSRPLYLYLNIDPAGRDGSAMPDTKPAMPDNGPIGSASLQRSFLDFVLSREGQEIIVREGFFLLPESELKDARSALTPAAE
ncbi:MAG: PstS family phosphate ABC transporter substrate-binding protein [Spirochaeta sp.]